MLVSTMFFWFIGLLVASFIVATVNIILQPKPIMVIHALCTLIAGLAGLGATITGVIWIVEKFTN